MVADEAMISHAQWFNLKYSIYITSFCKYNIVIISNLHLFCSQPPQLVITPFKCTMVEAIKMYLLFPA